MDSVRRADGDALTTEAALGVVDVGEVVGYGDGLELTLLEAERAADTGIAARLLGDPTLVLIDAADEDTATLGPFLRSSMMYFGQALTQAPQATHLSSRMTGRRVSGSMYMASKLHEWTQSARPRQPQLQSVSPL